MEELRQSVKEQFVLQEAALITAEARRTQLGLAFESEGETSGKPRKAGRKTRMRRWRKKAWAQLIKPQKYPSLFSFGGWPLLHE